MRQMMRVLVFSTAVALGCAEAKPVPTVEAPATELARLTRDSAKVDKSIEVTRDLIDRSDGEKYLPDLYMRLAELYVEKSRVVFFAVVEAAHEDDKAAVEAPEARLWKAEAISTYRRILAEFPEYAENDKVTFFIAHEYRELGNFPEMQATYQELVEKYPASPLRLEAWLVLGDHAFDKGDVDGAMQSYRAILKAPESPAHNMARYKLAWCYINKDKPALAVDLWEQAVKTPAPAAAGGASSTENARLDVREDALRDLAYYYAEARDPKSAIAYFQGITVSRVEYRVALEKLAKRFRVKTMYAEAAQAYRELIRVTDDVDRNLEHAQAIYEADVASRDLSHADDDVALLAAVSARYKFWWRASEEDKKVLRDYELLTRDLTTRLHELAKAQRDPALFARAAHAYEDYLSVFDDATQVAGMQANYADALYGAKEFVKAGHEYEKLCKQAKAAEEQKQALYSAISSYFEALKLNDRNTRFETMMARQGIKDLGGKFVTRYPDDKNTPSVKFNVARAFLEQGQMSDAIELFVAFVKEYPANKDAATAADLAIDAAERKNDFLGAARIAKELKAIAALPNHEHYGVVEKDAYQKWSDHQLMGKPGVVLPRPPADVPQEIAARNLWLEFVKARDAHDWAAMQENARVLVDEYPRTQVAKDVLPALAEQALIRSRMDEAARIFEQYAMAYPGTRDGDDDLAGAASIRESLGQLDQALADLEWLTQHGESGQRPRFFALLASTAARAGEWRRAEEAALAALDAHPVLAGAVAGEAAMRAGKTDVAAERLSAAVSASTRAHGDVDGPEWLARAQYLQGELVRADFEHVVAGAADDGAALQKKLALLDELTATYVSAIQIGDPEWSMGALYRVAMADKDAADFLDAMPAPSGLSPADAKKLKDALAQRSAPLRAQAAQAIDACKKKAKELDAFNRFTRGCNGAPVRDDDDAPKRMGARLASAERDRLEAKLAANPKDIAALTDLVRAALAAKDYPLAQVLAARGLELDAKNAVLHNLQGVAFAGENQMQAAADELKQAVKLDARYAPAYANLGALYAMYGNAEKAKDALNKAGGVDANSVDVIPQAAAPTRTR